MCLGCRQPVFVETRRECGVDAEIPAAYVIWRTFEPAWSGECGDRHFCGWKERPWYRWVPEPVPRATEKQRRARDEVRGRTKLDLRRAEP